MIVYQLQHTLHDFLCKPEIYKLQVALRVNEDVFGLHVSVCNSSMIVQKLKYENNFRGVEASGVFLKTMRAT